LPLAHKRIHRHRSVALAKPLGNPDTSNPRPSFAEMTASAIIIRTMAETNAVIDLSHHNGTVDLQAAKGAGILGVIHKATQGLTFQDPTYATNRQKAGDAGLLWGAYHFGTGADGVSEAEFFLNFVQPAPTDLLVLDFEPNTQGPTMTLDEARAFVTHIHEVTGRWPGIYSGSLIKQLLGTSSDPVLANCWFWLSQYGPTAVVPVNWPSWTMWQYTDGAQGLPPFEVAGVGRCDRDKFNGSADELTTFWQAVPPANIS
jgi:lysozyme